MSARPLLVVEGLGKRYKMYPRPWDRSLEWVSGGRLVRHTDFWALRDVSFTLERGECFGVIGPNGAGKSTLLRVLVGVLSPNQGRFAVSADRVYSLLELGTGLHSDLTGRENLHESADLLGLPPVDGDLAAQIQDFADLGDFFDRPVRFYSSGMLARLGFSLFAFLKPDLLIVDESLSVGDFRFQAKCGDRIAALQEGGTAFLFVSHDMNTMRRLCTRALVLERGRPVFLGPVEPAIDRYQELMGVRRGTSGPPSMRAEAGPSAAGFVEGGLLPSGPALAGGGLELAAVQVLDGRRLGSRAAAVGDRLHFEVLVRATEPVPAPVVGLALYNRLGDMVFGSNTRQCGLRLPSLAKGQSLAVRLSLVLSVSPGFYTFTVELEDGEPRIPVDNRRMLGPLEVHLGAKELAPFQGAANLPVSFRHGHVEILPAEPSATGAATRP